MKRLAVLISETGSNLQAIIDQIAAGDLDAVIAVVVSNRADASGLQRARRAGIPAEVLELAAVEAAGGDCASYDGRLTGLVAGYEPDLVVLAGWMLILDTNFLRRFTPDIIRLHATLPGVFPGANPITQAYAAYQAGDIKHTQVVVHRVIEEIDAGTVIVQEPVPIFPDDSLEDLEERVHLVENNLIVAAVDMVLRTI
jgi:phosphoribosylglycinamide formyltransferase